MNVATKLAAIAAIGIVTTWSSVTAAADWKTHSGAMCQPLHGVQAADFQFTIGGIFNTHYSSSRYVTCPMVRDITGNTNGATVRVRVDRGTSTGYALWCRLYSREFPGNGYFSAYDSTTANGDDEIVLTLNDSYSGDDYTMYCLLPPRSVVVNYRLEEG